MQKWSSLRILLKTLPANIWKLTTQYKFCLTDTDARGGQKLSKSRGRLLWMAPKQQNVLHTKPTAAQNEVVLSYHRVRGLYFPAAVFAAAIV